MSATTPDCYKCGGTGYFRRYSKASRASCHACGGTGVGKVVNGKAQTAPVQVADLFAFAPFVDGDPRDLWDWDGRRLQAPRQDCPHEDIMALCNSVLKEVKRQHAASRQRAWLVVYFAVLCYSAQDVLVMDHGHGSLTPKDRKTFTWAIETMREGIACLTPAQREALAWVCA